MEQPKGNNGGAIQRDRNLTAPLLRPTHMFLSYLFLPTRPITLKDNPKLIGTACLWKFPENNSIAKIGYELSPPYQGKDIMPEAVSAVLKLGFGTLKLKQIDAYVKKGNTSSIKLLTKHNYSLNKNRIDTKNGNNLIFTKKIGSVNFMD